jgi:hypothetical protein
MNLLSHLYQWSYTSTDVLPWCPQGQRNVFRCIFISRSFVMFVHVLCAADRTDCNEIWYRGLNGKLYIEKYVMLFIAIQNVLYLNSTNWVCIVLYMWQQWLHKHATLLTVYEKLTSNVLEVCWGGVIKQYWNDNPFTVLMNYWHLKMTVCVAIYVEVQIWMQMAVIWSCYSCCPLNKLYIIVINNLLFVSVTGFT